MQYTRTAHRPIGPILTPSYATYLRSLPSTRSKQEMADCMSRYDALCRQLNLEPSYPTMTALLSYKPLNTHIHDTHYYY